MPRTGVREAPAPGGWRPVGRYAGAVGGRGPLSLPSVELRPQSVLLTLFGDYLVEQGSLVSSASVLDVLETVGVGEHAARATLNRMAKRGLLERASAGRRAFFGLTEFGRDTVRDGRNRVAGHRWGERTWDGGWTLVSFSLPDEAQRGRHEIRSRLSWAGFGMVQGGLWAAPRHVDVAALLGDLDVLDKVNAFVGAPLPPTDGARLVRTAFDVDGLAQRYAEFLRRWQPVASAGVGDVPDPLSFRLVLNTDWLLVIRDDPRLPLRFLGSEWPGVPARALYGELDTALRRPAERAARTRLELAFDVDGEAVTGTRPSAGR